MNIFPQNKLINSEMGLTGLHLHARVEYTIILTYQTGKPVNIVSV